MAVLNTIQHMLTNIQSDQLTRMDYNWDEIVSLKDLDSNLFDALGNSPADERTLISLAERLLKVIEPEKYEAVILPLGSPAFMFTFAKLVGRRDFTTKFLFAHTERKSVDEPQPDGSVKKVAVFQHVKWLVL